ncbi:MAG: DHH family phosphoesterase [Candidatus Paceibacterota bacterium]|jgi:single-stranded-DNA-specific exonuclease|nr:DHH family phosphoesterase [Candidatus Paceibacterota bacterium]
MAEEIKNIKKAAKRIREAVKKGEDIILYGDADLDGVSSVIIMKESIRNLGGKVSAVYFPDREEEGYGVNEEALGYLKDKAPALMIVMDCGIGNFKELKEAKKMGIEVIILDHHKVLEKLPDASIIVDPKQKGDKYPFKEFAAAGIVYRVAEEILGDKMTSSLRNSFLELAAIATIADMMPQKEDNLEIISGGLSVLRDTNRPGLRAFFEVGRPDSDLNHLIQKIISACHAGGTKDHLNEAYILLTMPSLEKAKAMVEELWEKSKAKHFRIKEIVEEIEERLAGRTGEPFIFEGGDDWPVLMLGPAASRVCNSHKKPVFLYSQREEDSQGAVRTPKGIDSVDAMKRCAKLLKTYGGHPQASGFRVDNDKLEDFKNCLSKYFSEL